MIRATEFAAPANRIVQENKTTRSVGGELKPNCVIGGSGDVGADAFIADYTPCRRLPCSTRAARAGAKMAHRILNIFMRVRV